VRHIDDAERRARLVSRHLLDTRAADVLTATRAVGFLHGTEPANIYLSLAARADVGRGDIDTALFEERSIVRQLAMRRTVFAFDTALFAAVRGGAAARVEAQLSARLAKEVAAGGIATDGAAWVEAVCEQVRDSLAEGPLTTAQLRERIPAMGARIEMSPGKSYGGNFPIAPRVLSVLAADGGVVRGRNAAGWKVSRPYWTAVEDWLGADPGALEPREAYAEVVRIWLDRYGPGTEDDIVWWLGATKSIVRNALGDLGAVEVSLDCGRTGWVLTDDADAVAAPGPSAALLPPLDPTAMGWKERDFLLGPHASDIFDRNGNAGATAWIGGRIVGTWAQDDAGAVVVLALDELDGGAAGLLDAEAERLSGWLDGDVVRSVYTSPYARRWLAERA